MNQTSIEKTAVSETTAVSDSSKLSFVLKPVESLPPSDSEVVFVCG